MKDIKELALKVAGMDDLMGPRDTFAFTKERMADFATRLIAAYLAEQEPVAWRTHHDEPMLFPTINEAWQYCEDDEGPEPLFTAPPEPAQNLYREIYEVWAGSEGIPMPRTAPEAYLLGLLEQMVDIAKTGMHMTEPAPQTDGSTTVSAPDQERMSRSACAAPSSEEVQRMIGWLRVELGHLVTCQQAADMIERLAARVPAITHDEWYAAQNRISELLIFVKNISEQIPEKPDHWNSCSQCEHNASEAEDLLIAAGEVKP